MTKVGEAFVEIRPDTRGFATKARTSVLGPIKSIAIAAGGLLAFREIGGFLKDSIGAASDLNESVSKAKVVFGDASGPVRKFAEDAAESLGQSQQQALEAAATFGNLFVSMGIGQQKSAEMSTSLVTLASDLASFNNASPEEALEALRSGLVGETEPLRRFGVNLNDATLRQKALELGLISTTKDALDPATKAQAAYALILEQTKTAQGDFARTSDGAANKQRILTAKFDDFKAKIGQALLPAWSALLDVMNASFGVFEEVARAFNEDGIAGAVDVLRDKFGELSIGAKILAGALASLGLAWFAAAFPITALVAAIAGFWIAVVLAYKRFEGFRNVVKAVVDFLVKDAWPAIKQFAEFIAEQFGNLVGWVQDHWDQISEIIGRVVDAIRTYIEFTVAVIVQAWRMFGDEIMSIAQAAWDFIGDYVKAAVDLIRNVVEFFINIFTGEWGAAWDNIKGILAAVWDGMAALVGLGVELLKNILSAALSALGALWSFAWEGIKTVLKAAWDAMVSAVGTALQWIVGFMAALPGRIVSALGDLLGLLVQKGKDLIQGLLNGAKALALFVIGWVAGLPGRILDALGDVASVLYDAGVAIIQGLWDGLKEKFNEVKDWVTDRLNDLKDDALNIFSIGSPSKFTRYVGNMLMEGLVVGLDEALPAVDAAMRRVMSHTGDPFAAAASAGPVAPVVNQTINVQGTFDDVSARQTGRAAGRGVRAGLRAVS